MAYFEIKTALSNRLAQCRNEIVQPTPEQQREQEEVARLLHPFLFGEESQVNFNQLVTANAILERLGEDCGIQWFQEKIAWRN